MDRREPEALRRWAAGALTTESPAATDVTGATATTRATEAPGASVALDTLAALAAQAREAESGVQRLVVWLRGAPYLVALAELREALPTLPAYAALPFSPPWLLGVFPLRTELVALVDPWPILYGAPDSPPAPPAPPHAPTSVSGVSGPLEGPRALVVGDDGRLLALLVDRIGEIIVTPTGADTEDTKDTEVARRTAARYLAPADDVAGMEQPAQSLRVALLANDILATLEERPPHE